SLKCHAQERFVATFGKMSVRYLLLQATRRSSLSYSENASEMLSIATESRRRASAISLRLDFWTSIAVSRKTPSACAMRPSSSPRLRPGISTDVSPAARSAILGLTAGEAHDNRLAFKLLSA